MALGWWGNRCHCSNWKPQAACCQELEAKGEESAPPPPPVSPVQACPRPSIDQRPQLRKWQRRFVYRRERQVPFVLVN